MLYFTTFKLFSFHCKKPIIFLLLVVDCSDPGVPHNGYRHGNHYKYNGTINFSCKQKHHLEGAHEIKCQANGKWSAPIPECLGELSYHRIKCDNKVFGVS